MSLQMFMMVVMLILAMAKANPSAEVPKAVIMRYDDSVSRLSSVGSLTKWHASWGVEDLNASLYDQQLARLRNISQFPLRGWNSCGAFMWSTNETEMKANIDLTAELLQASGYNIIELDWYWYLDLNAVTTYLDEYGRPQPDVNRWPSSTGLQGFKRIIDYIHSKGMLFGLHVMRGISAVAVEYQLPVLGTNYTADEIYDAQRACPWFCVPVSQFYALKANHPGAQAYQNSLYAQFASWGVDMIKADCLYGDNYLLDQIQSVSDAIDHSGRPMLLSLSPGNGPNQPDQQPVMAAAVTPMVNVYRMTADTWASWQQWHIVNHWHAAYIIRDFIGGSKTGRYGVPAFPDYDNPPFGWLTDPYQGREPHFMSPLTPDEHYTVASFWMFSRAPMFYEGDLRTQDPFSLSLVTNKRAIQMMDYSTNVTVIEYSAFNYSVWRSDSTTEGGSSYVALFNIVDNLSQSLSVNMAQITGGHGNICSIQEIWNGTVTTQVEWINVTLPIHGSALYKVFQCQSA
jgi:alpha-galactosidase